MTFKVILHLTNNKTQNIPLCPVYFNREQVLEWLNEYFKQDTKLADKVKHYEIIEV